VCRLQKTVEGLSVVAITYYAVNLATYLLLPVAKTFGFKKYQDGSRESLISVKMLENGQVLRQETGATLMK
tara:strand:- start:1432 stop:1644 length:213 start_codon:yes stop_codon:yes gene_type:complete